MKDEKKLSKFDVLREKIKRAKTVGKRGNYAPDENAPLRFWRPTFIKGQDVTKYVIRVLPLVDADGDAQEPWIEYYVHKIKKADGQFKAVPCPRTLNFKSKCPICDFATKLWKSNNPHDQEFAKTLFRKTNFVSNIYVVEDPRKNSDSDTPIYEEKILMFEYGAKIKEKFEAAIVDDSIEFYSFEHGVNFKVKVKKQGVYNNYDASGFEAKETSLEQEKAGIEAQMFDLRKEILGKENFWTVSKMQELVDELESGETKEEEPEEAPEVKSPVVEEEDDIKEDELDDSDEEEKKEEKEEEEVLDFDEKKVKETEVKPKKAEKKEDEDEFDFDGKDFDFDKLEEE